MFKIGDIEIKSKVVLAPMAGYTSFGYRSFMEQFGVGLTYTEMISDMGLIYQNKETLSYLNFKETDIPCAVQLFGNSKETLTKAAKIVKEILPFVKIIDINMACPVKKVTGSGCGSSLLLDPNKIKGIVESIIKETGLYVTCKIRLGVDNEHINFENVIQNLQEGGTSLIAIHARTAKELYSGFPNFNILKDIKSKMKIPLIISGNIFTLNDAINALNITHADGVMIARGGIGNPTLIKQIDTYYKTGTIIKDATLKEQLTYMKELAVLLIKEKGEQRAMTIFRSIAPKFITGIPDSKSIRLKLSSSLTSLKSLDDIINEISLKYL